MCKHTFWCTREIIYGHAKYKIGIGCTNIKLDYEYAYIVFECINMTSRRTNEIIYGWHNSSFISNSWTTFTITLNFEKL